MTAEVLTDDRLGEGLAAHSSGVLCLIDLRVDQVNASHGRGAGDRVLAAFIRLLEQALPASAVVLRSGGQQFALVIEAEQVDHAEDVVSRLRLLWDRRAPTPCCFYVGVAPVEGTAHEAFVRLRDSQARRRALGLLESTERAHHLDADELAEREVRVVLWAVRSMLHATSHEEIRSILHSTVLSLGGTCLDQDERRDGCFELSISGDLTGLVSTPPGSRAERVLGAVLPDLMHDAAEAARRTRERGLHGSPRTETVDRAPAA